MDDWNEEFLGFEAEREIQKHNAERENLDLSQTRTASSSDCGCLTGILWFCAGLLLFRFVAEFLSLLF